MGKKKKKKKKVFLSLRSEMSCVSLRNDCVNCDATVAQISRNRRDLARNKNATVKSKRIVVIFYEFLSFKAT